MPHSWESWLPFLEKKSSGKSSATHPSVSLSTNREVIIIHIGLITFFLFLCKNLFPGVHVHGSDAVEFAKIHHPERFVIVLGGDDAVAIPGVSLTLFPWWCPFVAHSLSLVSVDGNTGGIRFYTADSRDAALYGMFAVGNVDCKTEVMQLKSSCNCKYHCVTSNMSDRSKTNLPV